METNAVSSNAGSQSLVSQLGGTAVDQEAFLNLLVTQLRNQDPFEPVENEQFLTQLATFTQLEETQAQGRTLESLLQTSAAQLTLGGLSQGASLVGRWVSWIDPLSGAESNGLVDQVTFDQNGVQLRIGDRTIPAGYVTGIASEAPTGTGSPTPPADPNANGEPTPTPNTPSTGGSGSGNPSTPTSQGGASAQKGTANDGQPFRQAING